MHRDQAGNVGNGPDAAAARRDALRALLRRQANTLAEEALCSDGQVVQDKLEQLAHLTRLVELVDAAQPRPTRARWPVAAAFLLTLAIASVLLFARVPHTELRADLVLSEVAFVLASQQVFADALSVSALGASGLERVELPLITSTQAKATKAVRVVAQSGIARTGTLDIGMLMLPAGTRVGLSSTGVSREFRLSLTPPSGAPLSLQVDVNGPVEIVLPGNHARVEKLEFTTPRSVYFASGDHGVDLDLTLATIPSAPFSQNLRIDHLAFGRVETFADPSQPSAVRRVSNIVSGALYFESLNGQKLDLRRGEWIELPKVQGDLRRLELRDDGIALSFYGETHGLRGGSEAEPRDLMPNYLQLLKENHALSLVWGTAGYLLALALGALRWWKADV